MGTPQNSEYELAFTTSQLTVSDTAQKLATSRPDFMMRKCCIVDVMAKAVATTHIMPTKMSSLRRMGFPREGDNIS